MNVGLGQCGSPQPNFSAQFKILREGAPYTLRPERPWSLAIGNRYALAAHTAAVLACENGLDTIQANYQTVKIGFYTIKELWEGGKGLGHI